MRAGGTLLPLTPPSCTHPPPQGNATTSGPVIVFLVPVGVGSAATSTALPQLQPPQSGDLAFTGNFTAADIGGPRAGSTLEQLVALSKVLERRMRSAAMSTFWQT